MISDTNTQLIDSCATNPDTGDWLELLHILQFPPDYLTAVQMVVGRAQWRKAIDPVRYIRSAARRQHLRLEHRTGEQIKNISELKLPRNEDEPMTHDDAIDLVNTAPTGGDWDDCFAHDRVQRKYLVRESAWDDINYTVDFRKVMDDVATIAGLKQSQRDAIERVLSGRSTAQISREQILGKDEGKNRKADQAAWKWITRNASLLKRVMARPTERP